MTKIILHGCLGGMGRTVSRLVEKDMAFEIVAGIDVMPKQGSLLYPVFNLAHNCGHSADVILDFSTAAAVPELIQYALLRKKPLIICTTGLTDACTASIAAAADSIAIFQSANMSLGINLVAKLIKEASAILYESGFDMEIIEKHHNQKVDAPSGTALFLANAMNNEGGLRYITDRSQSRQKRSREEIGISSVRGGTIVGEHNVIFAGESETIEITHTAESKDVFAAGALAAASFIKNKPPGLYGMEHLLSDHKYRLTE